MDYQKETITVYRQAFALIRHTIKNASGTRDQKLYMIKKTIDDTDAKLLALELAEAEESFSRLGAGRRHRS